MRPTLPERSAACRPGPSLGRQGHGRPRQQFVAPFGLAWPAGAGGVPSPLSPLAATDTGDWNGNLDVAAPSGNSPFLPLSAMVCHCLLGTIRPLAHPRRPGIAPIGSLFLSLFCLWLAVGTAAAGSRQMNAAVPQMTPLPGCPPSITSVPYFVQTQDVWCVFWTCRFLQHCAEPAQVDPPFSSSVSPFSAASVSLLSPRSDGRAPGGAAKELARSVRHCRDRP